MTILKKIASLATPLMLVAGMGLIMIGYGFVNPSQDNNVLQFIFGIPIALGAAGFHFLIRRLLHQHTLNIWILEAIIVAAMFWLFLHS